MSHKLGRLKLDPICVFVSQLKYIVFHCLWRFKIVGRVTITAVRICTLGLRCHKWVVKPIKDLVKTSAKATNCFRYVSSPFFVSHESREKEKNRNSNREKGQDLNFDGPPIMKTSRWGKLISSKRDQLVLKRIYVLLRARY